MTVLPQVKQQHKQRWMLDCIIILGYGLVIGLSSQFRVPLSFSPVPITGQTLSVLLAGGLLGPKRGGLAILTFVMLGTFRWLPFAGGPLFGPTGGYIFGFIAAAYFIGIATVKGWTKRWWSTLTLLLGGNIIIYVFGLTWLSHYVGWHSVLALGLYPFIIGDLFKIVCAFGLWRVFKPQGMVNRITHW